MLTFRYITLDYMALHTNSSRFQAKDSWMTSWLHVCATIHYITLHLHPPPYINLYLHWQCTTFLNSYSLDLFMNRFACVSVRKVNRCACALGIGIAYPCQGVLARTVVTEGVGLRVLGFRVEVGCKEAAIICRQGCSCHGQPAKCRTKLPGCHS